MATMYYRPYSAEPSQDDQTSHLPPHHAVDSVLPEYQYIFMDQPHIPAEQTPPRKNGKVPDLDRTHYSLLDQQMKEIDRYRMAVHRMGQDILALRQQVRELDSSNSLARREIGKYNDATRFMLDSSELDGLHKPELIARYMTLKQTLSSQTNELSNYKERVQTLQNQLIKKNEKEKEYLKMSNAHVTQQDLVQRLQDYVQKDKDMSKAFKKQEDLITQYEKAGKGKKTADKEKLNLMEENAKLRAEVTESKKKKPKDDEDEEKMELYEMLDRAEGRIMSLEKQMTENARKWGREKNELINKVREKDMGLSPTSPTFSDDAPRRDRRGALASSSRKLKPIEGR